MKISVITVTYNSAKTVRDTIESVLRQEYKDYEYLVIDGGSTDGTVNIIRDYESEFEGRLKWLSEPDAGIYDAMNKGIARATGDVVGLLNSDDFFSSTDILASVSHAFMEHNEIDAVYGDVKYVDQIVTTRTLRYYSSRLFRRSWMRMGFMPAHPSFYCKKKVYEDFKLDGTKIPGFKGKTSSAYFNTTYKIAADFENLLRMVYVGHIQTHYIQKDFVTMRTGGASNSGLSSHKQINADHLRAFKENGVYSNYIFISVRYIYKIIELLLGRFDKSL